MTSPIVLGLVPASVPSIVPPAVQFRQGLGLAETARDDVCMMCDGRSAADPQPMRDAPIYRGPDWFIFVHMYEF